MNNYALHRLFTVASVSLSREPSVEGHAGIAPVALWKFYSAVFHLCTGN